MRKIALTCLLALPLFAGFFPQTVQTTVSDVTENTVTLNHAFPVNGMSGVIVHNYGNDLQAITGRIEQQSPHSIKQLSHDVIHHENLPTIKTPISVGDKVIGGYLYENVLLLAPNAKTYAKITASSNKNWIHPDIFALFLAKQGDQVPTKSNLRNFAKTYQVGLIYIVNNGSAKLLDPISGKTVGTKVLSNLPAKGEAPFFMRFDEIESGMFSLSNKQNFYDIMSQL
ncbi:MAG: Unknown protein [uncultured Sulfurovum sp.]|uniref:Plasminogen-binding protein PgbA N-terminal domain-containing protein n=1 Tax=uncultured Sulfurovum sp. TaxID=269237 RepID=A0A6S6TNC0_9BACT|nr:MAG: Unknown protein [uncultured Sulfurovum sp.]